MQEVLGKLKASEHLAGLAAPLTAFGTALEQEAVAIKAKLEEQAKRKQEQEAAAAAGQAPGGGAPAGSADDAD
eukprot:8193664-Pyramimonas_sp.AAC.1